MTLRLRRLARRDLRDIHGYIGEHNPAAADRVVGRILQSIAVLEDHPMIGRAGRVAGTREWWISGLPYLAIYRVVGGDVEVLTIVHTSRQWP